MLVALGAIGAATDAARHHFGSHQEEEGFVVSRPNFGQPPDVE